MDLNIRYISLILFIILVLILFTYCIYCYCVSGYIDGFIIGSQGEGEDSVLAAADDIFFHIAPDGEKIPYNKEDNARISKARAAGEDSVPIEDVKLPNGTVLQFEVRFGDKAVSPRMLEPPLSRMIQVNIKNDKTRVVVEGTEEEKREAGLAHDDAGKSHESETARKFMLEVEAAPESLVSINQNLNLQASTLEQLVERARDDLKGKAGVTDFEDAEVLVYDEDFEDWIRLRELEDLPDNGKVQFWPRNIRRPESTPEEGVPDLSAEPETELEEGGLNEQSRWERVISPTGDDRVFYYNVDTMVYSLKVPEECVRNSSSWRRAPSLKVFNDYWYDIMEEEAELDGEDEPWRHWLAAIEEEGGDDVNLSNSELVTDSNSLRSTLTNDEGEFNYCCGTTNHKVVIYYTPKQGGKDGNVGDVIIMDDEYNIDSDNQPVTGYLETDRAKEITFDKQHALDFLPKPQIYKVKEGMDDDMDNDNSMDFIKLNKDDYVLVMAKPSEKLVHTWKEHNAESIHDVGREVKELLWYGRVLDLDDNDGWKKGYDSETNGFIKAKYLLNPEKSECPGRGGCPQDRSEDGNLYEKEGSAVHGRPPVWPGGDQAEESDKYNNLWSCCSNNEKKCTGDIKDEEFFMKNFINEKDYNHIKNIIEEFKCYLHNSNISWNHPNIDEFKEFTINKSLNSNEEIIRIICNYVLNYKEIIMNVNEYERRPGDYIDDFKDIRNHILGIVLKEFIGRHIRTDEKYFNCEDNICTFPLDENIDKGEIYRVFKILSFINELLVSKEIMDEYNTFNVKWNDNIDEQLTKAGFKEEGIDLMDKFSFFRDKEVDVSKVVPNVLYRLLNHGQKLDQSQIKILKELISNQYAGGSELDFDNEELIYACFPKITSNDDQIKSSSNCNLIWGGGVFGAEEALNPK